MRLVALADEDGFAFVQDGEAYYSLRPPHMALDPVPESVVMDAVCKHGFDAMAGPEETLEQVVARVRRAQADSRTAPMLSDDELLDRLVRVAPRALVRGVLAKLEADPVALARIEQVPKLRARLDRVRAACR